MKINILICIAFSIIITFSGCTEKVTELNNNGKITGKLYVADEVGIEINPVPSFEIQLYDTLGTVLYSTVPDADGRFSFENIKYGEYLINSKSENFVGYPDAFVTGGGPEEKIMLLDALEIPSNSITIDSIQIIESEYSWNEQVIMHFHFNGPINHLGKGTEVFVSIANSPDSTGIFAQNNYLYNYAYYLDIAEGQLECNLSRLSSNYYPTPKYLQAFIMNPASYSQSSSIKYLNMGPVIGKGSNVVEFYKPYPY